MSLSKKHKTMNLNPSKIYLIAGARPNFMKIAPIFHAMRKFPSRLNPMIVHTGQHYSKNMSDVFFKDLGLPKPYFSLEVGSGNHGEQTANVMSRFEKLCMENRPDLILLVGDVNSTLAAALVGAKMHIPVVHVEAGLRSRDRSMPEEINRIATDVVSDLLLTPSPDADINLKNEGIPKSKIRLVGDVMIDSLVNGLQKARKCNTCKKIKLEKGQYAVLTLHRPANVDQPEKLSEILHAVSTISKDMPIVFAAHPRTRKMIGQNASIQKIILDSPNIRIVDPYGYLDFLSLVMDAGLVLTDSGGLQEETSYLGIPCITIRENTERPITISHGSNILAGTTGKGILKAYKTVMKKKKKMRIKFWDGKTAPRIVKAVLEYLG